MVSIKLLTAAAATVTIVAPLASAYITGFTAPSSAAAGSSINATVRTSSYSQNWDDFCIIWGLATPARDCDTCVGVQIGYVTLNGTEGASMLYPYTFTLTIAVPNNTSPGPYAPKAAIPRLIGVRAFF